MAKTIVSQITKALPQLMQLSAHQHNLTVDYDKEADVLYIAFEKPASATDTEMVNEDILVRKRDDAVIGITVMHASSYR